jgi:hypothetical protein
VETQERQRHAQELTSLRQKFGVEDSPRAPGQAAALPKRPQGWQLLRFWKKRSS